MDKLATKTQYFFDTTTAHGFDKAFGTRTRPARYTKIRRFFWTIILILSFIGLVWTISERVTDYLEATSSTSFTSDIKSASGSDTNGNGLSFPSVSICSEGFSTEFASTDLMMALEEKLKYYYEFPNMLLQKVLNHESSSYLYQENYLVKFLEHIINDYIRRKIMVDQIDTNGTTIFDQISGDASCQDIPSIEIPLRHEANKLLSRPLFNSSESILLIENVTACYLLENTTNDNSTAYKIGLDHPNFNFNLHKSDENIFQDHFLNDFDTLAFHFSITDIITNPPSKNIDLYLHQSEFIQHLDTIFNTASNYSQFYKPRSEYDKKEIAPILNMEYESRDSRFDFVAPVCDVCVSGEDMNFNITNSRTSVGFSFISDHAYLDSQKLHMHYSHEIVGSNSDSQLAQYDVLTDFMLNPDTTIFSAKLFSVNLQNLQNSKFINISTHINFDSTCFRLDFDQEFLKQTSSGVDNGLHLELKIPKLYNGIFERPYPNMFPRRVFKIAEDDSVEGLQGFTAFEKEQNEDLLSSEIPDFRNNIFAMIYPFELNYPTTQGVEVSSMSLQANKLIKIAITSSESNYMFDPLMKNLTCSETAIPYQECLLKGITCNPLNQNSTCNLIYEPYQALNPVNLGCHPQNCFSKVVNIEKATSYDIETCENEEFRENSKYFMEMHESCQGSPNLFYRDLQGFKDYIVGMCWKKVYKMHENEDDFKYSEINKYHYDEICSILTGMISPEEIEIAGPNQLNQLNSNPDTFAPTFNPEILYDSYEVMIGFENLYITSISEVYLDTFISCLIDVVGMFGFWLGFSFITSVEFVMFIFKFFKNLVYIPYFYGYRDREKRKTTQHSQPKSSLSNVKVNLDKKDPYVVV